MRRAFTLIEILLTVAIFSIVVGLVSQSLTNGFLVLESQRKTDSLLPEIRLLRSYILGLATRELIEAGGQWPTVDDKGKFEWKAKAEPTQVLDLFCVQLEIRMPDDKLAPLIEEHYLYKPQGWYQANERSPLLQEKRSLYETIKSENINNAKNTTPSQNQN